MREERRGEERRRGLWWGSVTGTGWSGLGCDVGEPGVTFMNPVIISMTESVYAHVFVTCTCTVCYQQSDVPHAC